MRDTIIESVTVTEASIVEGQNGDRWKIKATVPSLNSRYPIGPMWKDVLPNERVKAGQTVTVKLRRGAMKNNAKGDMERDFFWELESWGTDEAPTPAPAAAPSGGNGATAPAPGNLDQRIAWNSAVNNAVALWASGEFISPDWDTIKAWASHVYAIITAGPPQQAQEAPETPVADAEPDFLGDAPPEGMVRTAMGMGATIIPPEQGQRPKVNPAAMVITSVKTWNADHPDQAIGQVYLMNALHTLYGIGEPTLKEGLNQLGPEQALGLSSHVANGTLAETLEAAGPNDAELPY